MTTPKESHQMSAPPTNPQVALEEASVDLREVHGEFEGRFREGFNEAYYEQLCSARGGGGRMIDNQTGPNDTHAPPAVKMMRILKGGMVTTTSSAMTSSDNSSEILKMLGIIVSLGSVGVVLLFTPKLTHTHAHTHTRARACEK